ncbi:MAG: substrate-binding domain-containing protein [Luteolibacter sp.]
MQAITLLSAAEQVAGHLREAVLRGELRGTIPGVRPLAAELGVNHKTVKAALKQLEDERLLVPQGAGLGREIVLSDHHAPPALRVQILLYEPDDATLDFILGLQHALNESGHSGRFASKSLLQLGMEPKRVARFVEKNPADAWVVVAASREVLEWFAEQPVPAFALFGRQCTIPMAGFRVQNEMALSRATRRLISLGHRRIVVLAREERRKPLPGQSEQVILNELQAAGISTGSFNLPDWEDNPTGFHQRLDSLFQHTPPTALITGTYHLLIAALQHLGQRGISVPDDVSLVSHGDNAGFLWCQPTIACIRWNHRPMARCVVRWANNVARGKDDRRKRTTQSEFVEGGTIGPVRKGRARGQ